MTGRELYRSAVRRAVYGIGGVLLLAVAATGCGDGDKKDETAPPPTTTLPTVESPSPSSSSTSTSRQVPVAAPGIVQGFANPEGAVVVEDRWFVSNIGTKQEPMAKDGDGFLTILNEAGTVTERRAIPRQGDAPLNAPKGMAFTNNTVYVADIDRVVGYDVDSLGQVFELPIGGEGPTLLNDIAVLDDKHLLVTDSARGAVYRLSLEDKKFEPLTTQIPGANGITIDAAAKVVYVAASGAQFEGGDLYKLELGTTPGTLRKVGSVHGLLDGVVLMPNGNIAVSDWVSADKPTPGTVKIYRTDGTEVSKVTLPGTLHGPADFALDASARNLLIPAMPDNNLAIVAVG